MIRTIIFAFAFVLSLIVEMLFLPGLWILKLIRARKLEAKYIIAMSYFWAHFLFAVAGIKVTVEGRENLPDHNRICFISNHQSYGDIPLIIGFLHRRIGFIAKKELGRVPILSTCMKGLNCIFIDRGQLRQAMRGIDEGMAQIAKEKSMVIFPEGTRAKDGVMRSFKSGGILMALRHGITVVPVTIDGLYRCYELNKKITPTRATIKIHPPVETAGLSREEQKELPAVIEKVVREGITIQEIAEA